MTLTSPWFPTSNLVRRIKNAYRLGLDSYGERSVPSWCSFGPDKKKIHTSLISSNDEETAKILANPADTYLYYGVDNLFFGLPSDDGVSAYLSDLLRQLVFSLGAGTDENDTERLLDDLDAMLHERVDFPNPFRGEHGLRTSRGVASFRALQAIYQAWRIRDLCKRAGGNKVLEIGAGMGRTAYYSNRLGIYNYTIVDLPATLVGISCFLAGSLGEDAIWMLGDPIDEQTGRIPLIPPTKLDNADRYDVAVNVDSLTEMRRQDAERYFLNLSRQCSVFLSINHEKNWFSVAGIPRALGIGCTVNRIECPIWPGMIEETFSFNTPARIDDTNIGLRLRWFIFGVRSAVLEYRWAKSIENKTATGLH